MVKPIYFEGHLVGWSGIFGHVMDIGGRVPGSVPINANQYYEEGIIIPPTKVYRRGELQTDLVNLIMHNSRASNSNRADLTALVAAAQLAARRVVEICERFGMETYLATCDLLLARNREAVSKLIDTSIPEGRTYYFEDYVCDDGCGRGPYKLACSMVKRGKKLYFDFDGTDPQSQGSINFIFNYEMFKMFVGGLSHQAPRPPDRLQRGLLRPHRGRHSAGVHPQSHQARGAVVPHRHASAHLRRADRAPGPVHAGADDRGRVLAVSLSLLLGLR